MKKDSVKSKNRIKITIRSYKLLHSMVPMYLPSLVVHAIADAILPFINVYMSALVISSLTPKKTLNYVLMITAIMVLLNLIVGLVKNATARLCDYYGAVFNSIKSEPLNEKFRKMDYEYVEDSRMHIQKEKIDMLDKMNGLGLTRLTKVTSSLVSNLLKTIFSITLVAGAFTAKTNIDASVFRIIFSPWASGLVIIAILVCVFIEVQCAATATRKSIAIVEEFTLVNRIAAYYKEYLTNYKAMKDIKLYSLDDAITDEFHNMQKLGFVAYQKAQWLLTKYDSYGIIASTLLTTIIYIYVALKALFGGFPSGNIVMYVGALAQFSVGISGFINMLSLLFLNTDIMCIYFELLDTPNVKKHGDKAINRENGAKYQFEFKNVSFKYPGTETEILKGINLKLHEGKRMAVVGMNGSGKTTMIKLLCRLYDPTEGEITLNGIDIREYEYQEYMDLFSIVFQEFKLFSFSIGQNVSASISYEENKTMNCLNKAGFFERLFPLSNKLETSIYKDFDEKGIEISGGEAQKIALARAIYKNAPFIVLDEPTAALDPIAEHDVYNRFKDIAVDKTVIFISHRLSSCKFCDDIAVFHKGQLVQLGKHETLIENKSGKYFELWHAQAKNYNL